jgi:hypothetical protein
VLIGNNNNVIIGEINGSTKIKEAPFKVTGSVWGANLKLTTILEAYLDLKNIKKGWQIAHPFLSKVNVHFISLDESCWTQ